MAFKIAKGFYGLTTLLHILGVDKIERDGIDPHARYGLYAQFSGKILAMRGYGVHTNMQNFPNLLGGFPLNELLEDLDFALGELWGGVPFLRLHEIMAHFLAEPSWRSVECYHFVKW